MTSIFSMKKVLQRLLGQDVEFEIVLGDDFKIIIVNWENFGVLRRTEIATVLLTIMGSVGFEREDTDTVSAST